MYNSGAQFLYCTNFIERRLRKELETLLGEYPIVTILGPLQLGKTTLAGHYLTDFNYRNLELPDVR